MNYNRTPIATAPAFDLVSVKARLRFTDSIADAEIAALAHAAVAEIEAYCDLAFMDQTITTITDQWPGCIIALPVGPVAEGATVTVAVIEADGTATPVMSGWWLEAGRYPRLHFTTTTPGARLRISYPAGYGEDAASVPADLALAIQEHVCASFDERGSTEAPRGLPPAVARIIARHRKVRA
ncbi:MAG: hypothetical protein Q7J44_06255 [Pseudotabrizicola sp.]|uniref:head-tail connector protein n=1 Tax=Pseudotabrizicola sp. TaxID=2939647 RepID=UPI0027169769|nr:hypothetical protein [Pseudotabrizicola sp.]MDO9638124.1 hypothetical protein [Pseudotabrizicola sp.]